MRHPFRAVPTAIPLGCLLAIALASPVRTARAEPVEPPGPDRYTLVEQAFTSYEWWLAAWSDNQVECTLFIDHDGLPTGGEIYTACGHELYDRWKATPPCQTEAGDCRGDYLVFVRSGADTRQVGAALPPPVVWLSLQGCAPYRSTFRCPDLPILVLSGEEPLAGESILRLEGTLDGQAFTCASPCQVNLTPTGLDGISLRFWAYSSYGDSSVAFEGQVRVAALDDPADGAWYTDVLSSQWRGAPLAGCSEAWQAFPPLGGVPDWLATPLEAVALATDVPYEYLAARLLQSGEAEAPDCENGGLGPDGQASACGLSAARPAVTAWQNRFDALILAAAGESGIPARLLKSIFSRESQFWPGVSEDRPEAGLGQMTENGADTALLWNLPFFEQFCPGVLDDAVCRQGYPQLSSRQQVELRRALVRSVDAFCADCPLGIDLARAEASIWIFSETLRANCSQAGILLSNTTGRTPGSQASYEDLWRFTLVNYNAGPGCLTLAVQETKRLGQAFTWENLSSHLTTACQGALDYVNDIRGEER